MRLATLVKSYARLADLGKTLLEETTKTNATPLLAEMGWISRASHKQISRQQAARMQDFKWRADKASLEWKELREQKGWSSTDGC